MQMFRDKTRRRKGLLRGAALSLAGDPFARIAHSCRFKRRRFRSPGHGAAPGRSGARSLTLLPAQPHSPSRWGTRSRIVVPQHH